MAFIYPSQPSFILAAANRKTALQDLLALRLSNPGQFTAKTTNCASSYRSFRVIAGR
jgi:hypothetical protein